MSLSPFLSVISEDKRLSDEFSPDSIKGYTSGPKRKKKALKKMNNVISGRLISLCLTFCTSLFTSICPLHV